ncbi:MAG TPA: class I SAM-dependent methyltransferase [Flavobacterium sp.]|jgi:hypothetical protein
MTRIEVLNAIIKKKNVRNYLEIGVNRGKCLFKIKGPERRFAVDPFFNFNLWKKVKACVLNRDNFKNRYFEVTSDAFFENNTALLKKYTPDLAFIDGLHTYKQSLRDTMNTLEFLDQGGIIVLHDCNPLDALAAYPADSIDDARKDLASHKDWKNIWNGDVWKTIVDIRKNHPELSAFVLNTDHGLGFVYKKEQGNVPAIFDGITAIENLDYDFLDANREALLNLKPVSYFDTFLKTI